MCGISGVYRPGGGFDPAEIDRRLREGAARMVHRGPDAEGIAGEGPRRHRLRPPSPGHPRPRPAVEEPAHGLRRREAAYHLQRRDLQFQTAPRGAPAGGSLLPHRKRHRGPAGRVPSLGRGAPARAALRHVRLRSFRRRKETPRPRPGPGRQEAALLLRDRRPVLLLRTSRSAEPRSRMRGAHP